MPIPASELPSHRCGDDDASFHPGVPSPAQPTSPIESENVWLQLRSVWLNTRHVH